MFWKTHSKDLSNQDVASPWRCDVIDPQTRLSKDSEPELERAYRCFISFQSVLHSATVLGTPPSPNYACIETPNRLRISGSRDLRDSQLTKATAHKCTYYHHYLSLFISRNCFITVMMPGTS